MECYTKGGILGFCWYFAPGRSGKNWDFDKRQLFLDPKQNPTYKAAFGVNRFENIRRHLLFDDKRTRTERLKQDKLAAFNYIWGLFIQNCKTQFSLAAYITVDEQLVPFRGRCPFTQYMPSKPAKYGIKIFWLCDASLPYAFNAKIYVGRQPGSAPEKNLGLNVAVNLTQCFLTFFDGDPISNPDRSWRPKLLLLPVYHSSKLYSNGIAKENILY